MGAFFLVTQSTQMSFFLAFNGVTKIERYLYRLVSLNGKHPMLFFRSNFLVFGPSPSRLKIEQTQVMLLLLSDS